MPREHWNDMPGDIAGSDADNLPGGFGSYNPDLNPDAMVDEVIENDVIGPTGTEFTPTDQQGGITAGTSYAEGTDTGSTVDPADLLEGEEAHPGAAVGFTGDEMAKRVPPPAQRSSGGPNNEDVGVGGPDDPHLTEQQRRNRAIETEGPVGGQGSAGAVRPAKKGKAA
ncbi:MAG TPA: hypothetical protein VGL77_00710 [Armatimonadota bacterium]|jgi:hypothetical protein